MFEHLILTRFSVRSSWGWQQFPRSWLDERLDLLETFCAPSVATQTATAFRWLVYCDESTDREVLDALEAYGRRPGLEGLQLIVKGPSGDSVRLNELIPSGTRILITTRLDSDDALAFEYVARVQAYAERFDAVGIGAMLLNFSRGYKLDARRGVYFSSFMPNSPFGSLFERVDTGRWSRTVLARNHSVFHHEVLTHQDVGEPGWLQVVHGGNVVNQISNRDVETERDRVARQVAAPTATREQGGIVYRPARP